VYPPLTSPNGVPVGALHGFTSMLMKMIKDFQPKEAVIVFDHGGKNFRHRIYPEYKANRPEAPEDLIIQLKLLRKVAKALNFKTLEQEGFEADDIIATLANHVAKQESNAIIISSDKDLMQLINDHVAMYDPVKMKYITVEDVESKFGVKPEKVREVQALMGDTSDNIPGVKGIGAKTAAKLINEYDNVANLLASLDKVENKRQQNLLRENAENAKISWKLVGLEGNINIQEKDFTWVAPEASKISNFLNEFGFESLKKRAENLFALKIIEAEQTQTNDNEKIIEIKDKATFDKLYKVIENQGIVAINLVALKDTIILSLNVNKLYVIKNINRDFNSNVNKDIDITKTGESGDLFAYAENSLKKKSSVQVDIGDLLENTAILKITFDLKSLLKYFKDCTINACQDLQLMDYCLSAGSKVRTIYELITHHDQSKEVDYLPNATEITADFIDIYHILKQKLFNDKLLHLYQDIDLDICYILHQMEQAGIKIDKGCLEKLSGEFNKKILELEQEIFAITKEEFNIASPSQLGNILFEKMQLPFAKKNTKSQTYSTSADILEKLSHEGHKIADLLLEYRHLAKLKNTYTDTLPGQADEKTSRIHTTFIQNSTTTGRLSSHDPNVQNIPIRSEEGAKIRRAFIAEKGMQLISADYSQIELRILSYVADVAALKEAFIKGMDIHTKTASQIFGVSQKDVDSELRRRAKAINFGIIYGISGFGLAKQLDISRENASNYITKYFATYPGIEKYMEETKEFAREHGYTINLLGRRCYLPMINSKNHTLRSFAERAAINAPLQSLTADIAKIAMIEVDKMLQQKRFKTKILLQIHDELIFEAPKNEVEKVKPLIKDIMEKSCSFLGIPMVVQIDSGDNWQEIH
ncbi:MAG: DNA polymerase I, partial [Rickettsiaceae bacterium]|nr:DNA polymerase I [Rickettsiaceae bacterium]